MFELVSVDQLKCNKTYKIVGNDIFKANYTGIFYHDHRDIYLLFDCVYNIKKQKGCSPLYCSQGYTYYKFISDNPQWNMERRAVNLIVRRLIGDACFDW